MGDVTLPSFDLSGKTALVTGATSGLGARGALILAKAGAKVAITGRRVDRLDKLKKEIESFGGKVLALPLDVTSLDSIKECVAAAEAGLGPIDILSNNAGVSVNQPVKGITPEQYDFIFNTNTRGAFFVAQTVGNSMIARGQGGSIINVASVGAHTLLNGLGVYNMTKAAVAMMTRSMAYEWARHNITVNALCPGYMETEMNSEWFHTEGGEKQINTFLRKRLGNDTDLDGALLLLASPSSRFITGSIITVDDGQSLKAI
jgi:NAD(P)-dependent dehydrogenase (short-subunit alcohol dehydrogenase family)